MSCFVCYFQFWSNSVLLVFRDTKSVLEKGAIQIRGYDGLLYCVYVRTYINRYSGVLCTLDPATTERNSKNTYTGRNIPNPARAATKGIQLQDSNVCSVVT